MVEFEVVGREAMGGGKSIVGNAPQPTETGYKGTVIAYPGEITKVKAKFVIPASSSGTAIYSNMRITR